MRSLRSPWLYCAPALALMALVAAYPLLRTLHFSFTDARLSTLDSPRWIGLENYAYLLTDPDWWRAVANTIAFASLSVSLELALGLAVALALHSRFRGRGALRAAVLVPWAIPTVVSARMWAWMLNDLYGVVNEVLLALRLIDAPVAWLAEDRLALAAVVAVDVWKTTPFVALLLLAGLQGIPQGAYEAARIEGATPAQVFRHVTLPLLRPALLVAVVFRALDALRIFDLPFVLTSSSKATAVMSVFARQQLVDFQDVGYGSAASLLVFCAVFLATLAYLAAGGRSR